MVAELVDGRSESALAQWRGLCQGRDVNALMTAGQLINWGMPTLAAEMLNALDCQRTLPLYLQASLLPKAGTRRTGRKSH